MDFMQCHTFSFFVSVFICFLFSPSYHRNKNTTVTVIIIWLSSRKSLLPRFWPQNYGVNTGNLPHFQFQPNFNSCALPNIKHKSLPKEVKPHVATENGAGCTWQKHDSTSKNGHQTSVAPHSPEDYSKPLSQLNWVVIIMIISIQLSLKKDKFKTFLISHLLLCLNLAYQMDNRWKFWKLLG